jgi:hypothetical protein
VGFVVDKVAELGQVFSEFPMPIRIPQICSTVIITYRLVLVQ